LAAAGFRKTMVVKPRMLAQGGKTVEATASQSEGMEINDSNAAEMARQPRNLGRAYLIAQLRRRGLSRRRAKRILNFVFEEMRQELARDEPVEFPFGWLEREKKISPHWEEIGDEPMRPYTVEHHTDAEGVGLLGGLESMLFGGWSWTYILSKAETPPYNDLYRQTPKPRRPRGRPRKTPAAETAR
jgi:hypothetical protein